MSLLRTVCLCLAFSSGSALKLGAATSRRAIMQKAAAVVPLAVAAPAFASLTPAEAAGRSFADGSKKMGSFTLQGTYSDPAHEGLPRTIAWVGGRNYQISGADEDKKAWSVIATKVNSGSISVDFTPKGGPSGVVAVQAPKSGDIKFPDGNVWKKLS